MKPLLHLVCSIAFLLISISCFSQVPARWSLNGNATSNGDFLGTTNNQPLVFYTNNVEVMRLKNNGELRVNSLGGNGNSFVISNNNGLLSSTPFPNNPNMVLTGNGTFAALSTMSGWAFNGVNMYNANMPGFVGIGTNDPQYLFDVNGDARVNGTLYAMGLVLATKMQADTVKGSTMISVNNNLNLSAGLLNEMYTFNGDLRIQSKTGYNGNTIFNAGTSGNVGIGVYAPQYKLDVGGDMRISGKLLVYRIVGTTGDSLIRFGDSTVVINHVTGRIFNNSNTGGLGLGQSAFGTGARSTAIGYRVATTATGINAVTVGAGVTNGLPFTNAVPNSLAVAFNSTVPTFFVGTANGTGTIGKVGIGTGNPRADFQVGNNVQKVTAGASYGVANTFSNSYIGFNVARIGNGQWETENDGGGNGGAVLLGDMGGGFRIIGIRSTGGSNQLMNDQFIADNTKLYVRNDGRVVIGSETMVSGPRDVATTLLTVDGSVVCRELFVTQYNWADSIFAPGYSLMPFDSLENYLNANKHLPGVPTEQEMKLNGSNLGQTDVILLAKIEELTLYMLQLQKQNAIMQKEIEALKQK